MTAAKKSAKGTSVRGKTASATPPRTSAPPSKPASAATAAHRDRIVQALAAAESSHRAQGLELLVDRVLGLPMRTLVDPRMVTGWILEGLKAEVAVAAIHQHARPAWQRQLASSRKARTTPGDLLTKDARKILESIVTKQPVPRADWAQGAVDPRLVAALVAPVLEELLLSFTRKLPFVGGVAGSGSGGRGGHGVAGLGGLLMKSVEKRAGQLADAGRFVLGGFGVDVEKQIQAMAAEVSHAATDELRGAFVARMKSKEGKALLGKMRLGVLARVLETPIAELSEIVEPIPWNDAARLVSAVLGHAPQRQRIAALVREELDAAMAVLGDRTLGALLVEAGLLDRVRADVLAVADPVARELFASSGFKNWLSSILDL